MAPTPRNDSVWFRWRGPMGFAVLCPIVFMAVASRPVVREGTWPDLILEILGWAVFCLGMILRFWSTLYIGGHKDKKVVTEGPYSLCRNPLYVGSFCLVLGTSLFAKSLTLALGCGLISVLYMAWTIPAEERFLLETFGHEYAKYRDSVPRCWPRLRGFRTSGSVSVKVKGLRIEARRAAVWIFVPSIVLVLTHLRRESWWPNWFSLP
jgi:protein-S-isoprenylcysteine O-methyltransferase Ste14